MAAICLPAVLGAGAESRVSSGVVPSRPPCGLQVAASLSARGLSSVHTSPWCLCVHISSSYGDIAEVG